MKVVEEPRLPESDLGALVRQLVTVWRPMAQQVNQLSEGQAVASYNAVPAMPTTGTYSVGDFVQNSAPTILGAPGSRYVVRGWIRITNGSSHVLNTDWTEARCLTGL